MPALRKSELPTWLANGRLLSPILREQLALCAAFPDRIMFLDIETTGLSHYYDEITTVGWSIDGRAETFIKGGDPRHLLRDAGHAKVLVTFNGIRFDARFLRQEFPEIALPSVHIDLMYLCRRLGLKGGQKSIETELGLNFRQELEDVDGFAAVLLWHRYLRGDVEALSRLIRYNRADIAAMGAIFDKAMTGFSVEADLFSNPVRFVDWSAPLGWNVPPSGLQPAPSHLLHAPHFDELFASTSAKQARIVGIDLTGSEKRPTGWCLLDGSVAQTRSISSDEDIIAATLDANPDLVSIDSPLCLPAGRITVEDTDPGRDLFGIMRQSERELKRRGINVYPCLLPSMQKLTARGMRLAAIFRQKGVPVIESYPGAAQDIMRIPRKGAGVEWLHLGLRDFGISGNFQTEKVTHDELDAITSALVGTFHLAGLSEALGTEAEAPLVIPKLDALPGPFVVGVSGPIAAGKTTFAEALAAKGFAYTRFSLAIDDLLTRDGLELNRANRQALGTEINVTGRQRWLAEQTIKRVAGCSRVVVDGLRFPEDHAFLVETFGNRFVHVYVDAEEHIRRLRYLKRTADSGFDQAIASVVERRVTELIPLAHQHFLNHADFSAVQVRVDELFGDIRGEGICQYPS
ncbi:ribonuclease H-like domain-containing protein [Devosia sp. Root635]|uniref:ribonuclease H-like domain-containing protein n=1 Tax=Devosia sp. Root635 TaxID=1736575 RepID=UPI0009E7FA82|nr:ribonuclease H-like domain-containing protein [Devosia sp. Root635]